MIFLAILLLCFLYLNKKRTQIFEFLGKKLNLLNNQNITH